ncbi:MAG: hypothetical protein IT385_22385 [Deltaproteobacteria bacterium]|nr:hypothetical protein [Deltaproteobacteria bacterium]
MTTGEYAEHAGTLHGRKLTRQAIDAAVKRGDIPVDKLGRVIVSRADREWAPSTKGRPRRDGQDAPPPPIALDAPAAPGLPTAGRSTQVIQSIKAAREVAAWKREQGQLIERATVAAMLGSLGRRLREAVEAMPLQLQAACEQRVRCASCGSAIDGRLIGIAAEQRIAEALALIADDPLAALERR